MSRRALGGLAAVVVVLGVAAGVLLLMGGATVAGGADSPEALVDEFVEAFNQQDPVGMLALVHPDEGQALAAPYTVLVDRLREAGILDDGSPWSGFTTTLGGLDVDVAELGPGAVRLELRGGDLRAEAEADAVQAQFRPLASNGSWTAELPRTFEVWDSRQERPVRLELFVVAVEHGGRWFLSPVATGMQYLVEWLDLSEPDFDFVLPRQSLEDDPQAALEELVDRVVALDTDGVLARLAGADTLVAYRDAIDDLGDWAEQELRAAVGDDEIPVELEDLDIEVGTSDGRSTTAPVTAWDVAVRDGDRFTTGTYDGSCLVWREETGESESCIADRVWELSGLEGLFVVLREESGGWGLDVMGTLAAYAERVASGADVGAIARALDLPWLGTPQPVAVGDGAHTLTLSAAGTATAEFSGTAGDYLAVTVEDAHDVEMHLVPPDGDVKSRYGLDTGLFAAVLPVDGTYRLVAVTDDWEPGQIDLALTAVSDLEEVEAGPIAVELAANEVRGYRILPTGRGFYVRDGHHVEVGSIRCWVGRLCTEPLELFVGGPRAGTYRVAAEPATYGFADGQWRTGATLGFEAITFEAYLPPNATVDIRAIPVPDLDVVLEVETPTGDSRSADGGLQGDVEVLTATTGTAGADLPWLITVDGWGSSVGDVEVELVVR